MRKLYLIILSISSLLYGCTPPKPTVCDCIDETIEQTIELRDKGILSFESVVGPKCTELLEDATPEQQKTINKSSQDCPNYYKLDSLQKLKEKDWLKEIEKMNMN